MNVPDATIMLAHDVCIEHAHRSVDGGYEPRWEAPFLACYKIHKAWSEKRLYNNVQDAAQFIDLVGKALP